MLVPLVNLMEYRQVVGARSHSTLRRSTGARKANKIAAVETAGKGYRADLRPVSSTNLPPSSIRHASLKEVHMVSHTIGKREISFPHPHQQPH